MSNDPVKSQAPTTEASENGAYETLLKRLQSEGKRLHRQVDDLNEQRLGAFDNGRMEVLARLGVRTDSNCVPRDIARVGEHLLLGYNSVPSRKVETRVEDVFALYRLVADDENYQAQPVALNESWLNEQNFRRDVGELFTYYRDARLVELTVCDDRLLAHFQVGERTDDIRVFRWSLSADGSQVSYIDNRGERDIASAASHDFEWTAVSRERVVSDRYPRIGILDGVYAQLEDGLLVLGIGDSAATGQVLYQHSLAEKNQSLPDLQIACARLGHLVLLRVRPYKESRQYLVCNLLTQTVIRIDAIGQACLQLPDNHGLVFPGGFYLQSGEHKIFEASFQQMHFKSVVRSPGGEDLLYRFYDVLEGRSALFAYNTIRRELQAPIFVHGYACFPDGRMMTFSAEGEAARNHSLQIWQTPFFSEDYTARQVPEKSVLGGIGNAELVRAISSLYDLARLTQATDLTAPRLGFLKQQVRALLDNHHWLSQGPFASIAVELNGIGLTGEAIHEQFDRNEQGRSRFMRRLQDARDRHLELTHKVSAPVREGAHEFVTRLEAITELRGHVLTLRTERHADVSAIDAMAQNLSAEYERIAADAADFIAQPDSLLPYEARVEVLTRQIEATKTVAELEPPMASLTDMAASLNVLSGLAEASGVADLVRRTQIIQAISHIYRLINQTTARAQFRRKSFSSSEVTAQFSAQFQLFSQGITHALSLANTLVACDEQLARLLIQADDLESRFAEHPSFVDDVMLKREELVGAFEQHRQNLLDARQRQVQAVDDAAHRILASLPRRIGTYSTPEQLAAFFVTDPQLLRLSELVARLRSLDDNVKADDLNARLNAVRDQALRTQRDRLELFDSSGKVMKLGPRHRFSINTQALDLTLLPRDGELWVHITGTDYHHRLAEEVVPAMRRFFTASIESESDTLYRAEYLAWQVLAALADAELSAMEIDVLEQHIRDFCAPLYKEGYEKGVHDHDAARIAQQLIPCMSAAGLLRFSPEARALALIAWHLPGDFEAEMQRWPRHARFAHTILRLFNHSGGVTGMRDSIEAVLRNYAVTTGLPASPQVLTESADYLLSVLAEDDLVFEVSAHALETVDALDQHLQNAGCHTELVDAVQAMEGDVLGQWSLIRHWVVGVCQTLDETSHYAAEAVALLLLRLTTNAALRVNPAPLTFQVSGLLGEHPTVSEGVIKIALDNSFARFREHRDVYVPQLQAYHLFRQSVIQRERNTLRIAEFQPKPLASFVRNRLVDEIYLPLIADNLARQIGAAGEGRRRDHTGLLMLISPPGYGKTTLIEYIVSHLGMALVKINGPALGHRVASLDPAQAPDGPSRMELEKVNLALEMGSNVCLLIDDIQHLSPEFLQKFISLCDGTRQMESVWKGETRTRDLRGKRFCIVMAGNPYTESGQAFRIPDMLVNRADVHNLGDVTGSHLEVFALSYLENCVTSNPVLAPLATRDIQDLYRLLEHVQGGPLQASDLSYDYSRSDITELIEVLRRLIALRDVLMTVNKAYIDSAAQAEASRTEPPFRLQGSYRDMNKLAEKISAVMNETELDELITDYYRSEAQLLTSGAEENLLKLAQLRGRSSPEQETRWAQVKEAFLRSNGANATDVGNLFASHLGDAVSGIRAIADALSSDVHAQ